MTEQKLNTRKNSPNELAAKSPKLQSLDITMRAKQESVKSGRVAQQVTKAQKQGKLVKVRTLKNPKDLNDKYYWYSRDKHPN